MTDNEQIVRRKVKEFADWLAQVQGMRVPRNGRLEIHFDQQEPSAYHWHATGRFGKPTVYPGGERRQQLTDRRQGAIETGLDRARAAAAVEVA